MGFFEFDKLNKPDKELRGLPVAVLHAKGCDVCPLKEFWPKLRHPNMEPSGTIKPDVYIIGEAPGKDEDRHGRHVAGALGTLLQLRIPEKWDDRIRWNNVVRTRPPDSREPSHIEMECCRPSIVRDIQQTKPTAIFGLGPVPLQWAIKQNRITAWAGRRVPVKIGNHTCWFFPMLDPKFVSYSRRKSKDGKQFIPRNSTQYGSDTEFKFALDMKKALRSISSLPEPIVHTEADARANVRWVTGHKKGDLNEVLDFIDRCYDEDVAGLDYETSKLRPYIKGAKILTAALAVQGKAFAFPLDHKDAGWSDQDLRTIKKAWRKFLLRARCRKVSHHLGFEAEWSGYEFGPDTVLADTWEDSMAQAYILDERPNTHGLNVLTIEYFGIAIKDLFVLDSNNMESERLETVLEYNGIDAKYHEAVFYKQEKRLKQEKLTKVYRHNVRRTQAATLTTLKGVPINSDVVEDFYEDHTKQAQKIEDKIYDLEISAKFKRRYGHELRPSSTKDVEKALTQLAGVKLEPTKKKKFKFEDKQRLQDEDAPITFSTNEEALLKVKHPLAGLVIEWRKVYKLLSTYIIPVRAKPTKTPDGKVHETYLHPDGLLHPIVATCKTRTWRTSSEAPNVQNWHKRGPARYIRKQVTVNDDETIVAIDYAGIQARNVAMESLDPVLIQHYWDRYDIHSDWLGRLQRIIPDWRPLSDIGDVKGDKLHKELRSVVKNKFVFPSFFGAVGKTIAGYLGIDVNDGQELSDEFFDEFRHVKAWHEDRQRFYKENGYVTGLSGFLRRAPIELNQLINAPIQGDEAFIVCDAWYRLCATRDQRLVPNWMIHDDLSWVWKKKDVDKLIERVVPIILLQVNEWEKVVPMEVEVLVGKNWCDLKEIAKFETTKKGDWREVPGTTFSDRWDYKVGYDGVPETRQHGWEK